MITVYEFAQALEVSHILLMAPDAEAETEAPAPPPKRPPEGLIRNPADCLGGLWDSGVVSGAIG